MNYTTSRAANHLDQLNPGQDHPFSMCWSPRRRKLLAISLLAFVVALLLFANELTTSDLSKVIPTLSVADRALTMTTTVTAPAATQTVYRDVIVTPEPVVFVLIMWSEVSAAEGAILIKSILMYNSSPSEFHIICDDAAENYLRARFARIERPASNIKVRYYKPSWQSMQDRVDREGSIQTDHSAGLPGLMKLFIHEIVPLSVTKGIYVDTDAFFISDPTSLWKVFDTLKPSTAIVMSSHPDQSSPEWHHASRICSCVMLLDLQKLRDLRLMDSSVYREDKSGQFPPALSPDTFRTMYGLPGGDGNGRYDNVRLGDQGYWWAIVHHRPDIFEPLSYDYEVTSCLLDSYLTGLGEDTISKEEELGRQIHLKDTPQEGKTVLPKLLHFNCLHGTPIYTEWSGWSDPTNSLAKRWGAAVAYHVGYKWIWLNRKEGDDTSVDIASHANILFADDQFHHST
ncbi:hypothetical protein BDQ12DRAFT_710052 [Crucibulum laeve]|uniref:Glycosyltransferase family 8 protein n=1 Tax=Crucibulum laeve TaxID=68775 RepID=A0A5C3MG25_9AGAR|nr:hypothetical protein BDQ12DRAFT_710052 [Crucibulum laeve]